MLAAALGCSVEEGRQTLHAVPETGYLGWLYPSTDYIASCHARADAGRRGVREPRHLKLSAGHSAGTDRKRLHGPAG